MTDERIIDIFEHHGQYVTPRDYALIRAIAEAVTPQRTWVGLTDDDEIPWDGVDAKSFAQAIEAKLKEKNT